MSSECLALRELWLVSTGQCQLVHALELRTRAAATRRRSSRRFPDEAISRRYAGCFPALVLGKPIEIAGTPDEPGRPLRIPPSSGCTSASHPSITLLPLTPTSLLHNPTQLRTAPPFSSRRPCELPDSRQTHCRSTSPNRSHPPLSPTAFLDYRWSRVGLHTPHHMEQPLPPSQPAHGEQTVSLNDDKPPYVQSHRSPVHTLIESLNAGVVPSPRSSEAQGPAPYAGQQR